jgi:hypothetical protein
MSVGIANAQMEVSAAIDLEGLATWRITITFPDADIEEVKVANSIEIELSFDFDSSTPEGNMQLAFNAIKLYCKENALAAEVIGASGLALVISFLPLATIGTSIVEIGAGLLALAKLLMPAFGRKKDED